MLKNISSWIDRNKNLIINILLDLLSFDTTNPPGDTTEIVAYIREFFDSLGFKYMEVTAHKNKPNLIIHNDLEGPALFLYNGHMDVVPVFSRDEWICDPFKGCISNGFIYGRGTADMKGSLASLMVGVKSLVENNIDIDKRIELHFVADEEAGGIYGTKYLVEKGYVKARYGLVGESSVMNNEVYIRPAVRGGVWVKLKSFGKAGHASNPKSGVNAVLNMARVLTYLNDNFKLGELYSHDILPSPTISVGTTIKGGVKDNVIPDYCEATCDIRIIPGIKTEDVSQHIRDLLSQLKMKYPDLNIEFEITHSIEPAEIPLHSDIIEITKAVVKSISGYEPGLLGGTGCNDSTYLINGAGVEAISGFGPGDGILGNAHAVNERVSIDMLIQFAKYYSGIIYTLYNKGEG